MDFDRTTQTELEAAVFRRLVAHLQSRADVQNIDLMTLAGFCRNCLGNWFAEAAASRGLQVSREEGRAEIYGMPYAEWKELHQRPASQEAQTAFVTAAKEHE